MAHAFGLLHDIAESPIRSPTRLFGEQAFSATGDVFPGKDLTRSSTVLVDQKATMAKEDVNAGGKPTLKRRHFFKLAFGGASAVVTIAFSEKSARAQSIPQLTVFKPLPFPPLLPPADPGAMSENVKRKIDYISQKIENFQNTMFRINGKNVQILAQSAEAYNRSANAIWEDLANFLLKDMQSNNELSLDQQLEISRFLQTTKSDRAKLDYVFGEVVARYFALHGFEFYHYSVVYEGWAIPALDIRPVVEAKPGTETLEVSGARSIPYQQYTLGLNRIREPHRFNSIFPEESNLFRARWGTDQLFYYPEWLEPGVDFEFGTAMDILEQFPKIRNGNLLNLNDVSDPLRRIRYNFMVRGLQLSMKDKLARATREEIRSQIRNSLLSQVHRHEVVHIEDGQHSDQLRMPRDHKFFTAWTEIRGQVGSVIGFTDAHSVTARLFVQAEDFDPRDTELVAHGLDVLVIRNRLGYWYWRTYAAGRKDLQLPEGSAAVNQFVSLPISIQTKILDSLPLISKEELWALYQKVWDEMDKGENPLTLGLDMTVAGASAAARSTASESATKSNGFSPFAMTLTIASSVIGALAVWRWRRGKGHGLDRVAGQREEREHTRKLTGKASGKMPKRDRKPRGFVLVEVMLSCLGVALVLLISRADPWMAGGVIGPLFLAAWGSVLGWRLLNRQTNVQKTPLLTRSERRAAAKVSRKQSLKKDLTPGRLWNRRAFILGGLGAAAGGALYWWRRDELRPPPSDSEAHQFVEDQISTLTKEWQEVKTTEGSDKVMGLQLMLKNLAMQEMARSSGAMITLAEDAAGFVPVDPSTRFPKFTFGLNRQFVDECYQTPQAGGALMLRAMIEKELDGLLFSRQFLEVSRSERILRRLLAAELKRYHTPQGTVVSPDDFRQNRRLQELSKYDSALWAVRESRGYVGMVKYLLKHKTDPTRLYEWGYDYRNRLPLLSDTLGTLAIILNNLNPELPDFEWRMAQWHINEVLKNGNAADLALQQLAYILAEGVEGVEGRAPLVDGRPKVERNPTTGLPTNPDVMGYIREEKYFAPRAESLLEEFGQPQAYLPGVPEELRALNVLDSRHTESAQPLRSMPRHSPRHFRATIYTAA